MKINCIFCFLSKQGEFIVLGANRLIAFARSSENAHRIILESDHQQAKERAGGCS